MTDQRDNAKLAANVVITVGGTLAAAASPALAVPLAVGGVLASDAAERTIGWVHGVIVARTKDRVERLLGNLSAAFEFGTEESRYESLDDLLADGENEDKVAEAFVAAADCLDPVAIPHIARLLALYLDRPKDSLFRAVASMLRASDGDVIDALGELFAFPPTPGEERFYIVGYDVDANGTTVTAMSKHGDDSHDHVGTDFDKLYEAQLALRAHGLARDEESGFGNPVAVPRGILLTPKAASLLHDVFRPLPS